MKATMLSIRPQWTKMIFDGTKQYEFRNKLPKDIKSGMKVYVYETLGKKNRHEERQQPYGELISEWYEHEGLGMVVGEFTVGDVEIIGANKNGIFTSSNNHISYDDLLLQGYTNQNYAIEITNLHIFDEPKDITEFVSWSKVHEVVKKYNNDYQVRNSIEYLMKNRKGYWEKFHISKCYLTKAPQKYTYIYVEE